MSLKKPGKGRGSVTRICPSCGEAFRAPPSIRRRFCSMACRVPNISRPIEERFWERVEKSDGCWNWNGGGAEYGALPRGPHGTGSINAHVFSWTMHHGPVPEGLCVLHRCDNRRCVRPDHLFLGTRAENIAAMVSKGHQARGEKNGAAKLSAEQVIELRTLEIDNREAAELYGITKAHVRRIRRRERWGYLQ